MLWLAKRFVGARLFNKSGQSGGFLGFMPEACCSSRTGLIIADPGLSIRFKAKAEFRHALFSRFIVDGKARYSKFPQEARVVFGPIPALKGDGFSRLNWSLAQILCTAFFLLALPACSQAGSNEYPLKAAFLLNFAEFTQWPTNAFATPHSPVVIAVLGKDPFGNALEETVRGQTLCGRTFIVKRYEHPESLGPCHILFISQSAAKELDHALHDLRHRPILTVTDIAGAPADRTCIRFVIRNRRIRFIINADALKTAGLAVSSKLLRLAEITPGDQDHATP
ncbi:MAG TPA: YfiR family protein [Verrucomicrobiae bacterium]|nr:YfiR family protein [Verrucomicrobiae bacterium]